MIAAGWHWGAQIGSPVLERMLERRVARGKEDAGRLGERRGEERTPRPPGRLLWCHAASVGEALSVLPVLASLKRQDPALTVLFTTGTLTSARLLQQRLPELGLDRVIHRFVPLDVPAWAARFLDHWRPDAAAFVESELWPNLLAACKTRGIPMMLVNARMSAGSLRRWRWVAGFARQVVGAFDCVHAQSADYAHRLEQLGARRLLAPGNLKLAAASLPVDAAEASRLSALIGARPVWLAASTHPGEEALAADVHNRLAPAHPGLLSIIVPRHPDRGAAVAAELGGVPRRSLGDGPPGGGLWLADTLGELGLFYTLAPIVFIGRSLVGRGGQNPLEAARFGAALAVGPHVGNFSEVAALLEKAGGLARVDDAAGLAGWINRMLLDAPDRARMGSAARSVATGESALPGRIASALLELLPR
ncbi:MAG: 3-deoxy-D-manno-octulosonic acid transferase [Acetobacteraceae bacterium]|nr:3-deoxy-D-manno-octulosonic acid transferase [Acetobacteraceae bacterium]